MEPAISKKYWKTVIWLSCRHTEGSAFSSATSPSRWESALRSTWRWVLIFWHLDLQVSRAGLWGKSCCCWIGSVWGDKVQKRKRGHLGNVCDKAFKSLQMPRQDKISAQWPCVCLQGWWKEVQTQNSINNLLCWFLVNLFVVSFFLPFNSGFLKQTYHKCCY